MFDDVLNRFLEVVDGATCALLAGRDGVVVSAVVRPGGPAPDAIAAAMADLFGKAGAALRDAELSDAGELTLGGAGGVVVLREVAPGFLLAACLGSPGNLGRARFELRKAAAALEPELV